MDCSQIIVIFLLFILIAIVVFHYYKIRKNAEKYTSFENYENTVKPISNMIQIDDNTSSDEQNIDEHINEPTSQMDDLETQHIINQLIARDKQPSTNKFMNEFITFRNTLGKNTKDRNAQDGLNVDVIKGNDAMELSQIYDAMTKQKLANAEKIINDDDKQYGASHIGGFNGDYVIYSPTHKN